MNTQVIRVKNTRPDKHDSTKHGEKKGVTVARPFRKHHTGMPIRNDSVNKKLDEPLANLITKKKQHKPNIEPPKSNRRSTEIQTGKEVQKPNKGGAEDTSYFSRARQARAQGFYRYPFEKSPKPLSKYIEYSR